MKLGPIEDALKESLEDERLSRSERRALGAVFGDLDLGPEHISQIRHRAFQLARAAIEADSSSNPTALKWLEGVVKLLFRRLEGSSERSEVLFSPGPACRDRIVELVRGAAKTADVCVFTITDNTISRALRDAHRRGVKVRIITDNDKSEDRGSDIDDLRELGVQVATDRTSAHMHHKYAVFDGQTVLTGSYNWTRSAAEQNQENILITDAAPVVGRFVAHFQALWGTLVASN